MTQSNQNSFKDPYEDAEDKVRLQTRVSRIDHDTVTSIRPGKGTIQIVNNKLWYEFCRALKKAGISGLEHRMRLEGAVAGIEVSFKKKGK